MGAKMAKANVFEATREGTCIKKGDPIRVGQRIVKDGDGYSHADCLWPDKAKGSQVTQSPQVPEQGTKVPVKSSLAGKIPPLPEPLKQEDADKMLNVAVMEVRTKFPDLDDDVLMPAIAAQFTARLQRQQQEFSVAMSQHIDASKRY